MVLCFLSTQLGEADRCDQIADECRQVLAATRQKD
jgi:hypothetical protein